MGWQLVIPYEIIYRIIGTVYIFSAANWSQVGNQVLCEFVTIPRSIQVRSLWTPCKGHSPCVSSWSSIRGPCLWILCQQCVWAGVLTLSGLVMDLKAEGSPRKSPMHTQWTSHDSSGPGTSVIFGLGDISAKERRHHICEVISHWVRYCSWDLRQYKETDSESMQSASEIITATSYHRESEKHRCQGAAF